MRIEITLKNYRCFPDTHPVQIVLDQGFISLVGVNNSGKSSLLKCFFELRPTLAMLASPNGNLQELLRGHEQGIGLAPSVRDVDELFCNVNEHDLEIHFRVPTDASTPAKKGVPTADALNLTISRANKACRIQLFAGGNAIANGNEGVGYEPPFAFHITQSRAAAELSHLFRAFEALTQTLYIGAFRNAINVGEMQDYFDIQVGRLFIQRWKEWHRGPVKKASDASYRLTEEIRGIFGFQDLQIDASSDGTTLHLFIDGRSYMLPEVGSGIAQFILVLANAAVKRPSYILIDEPELNLHPSLQQEFLTTLGSYAREGVVFATHSLGLALNQSDAIYVVRRIVQGHSEVTPYHSTPRLSEFLGELSYSGYSSLGVEKVLLVEGATEVKTVQRFLQLYGKAHQLVILPLGGSTMINGQREEELREVKRICKDVSALIDSEKPAIASPLEKAREDFKQVCAIVGINCTILDRRSMENYFSDAAIKKVQGPNFGVLAAHDPVPPGWSKKKNWRIAWEMTKVDIEKTDLGMFLDSL